LHKIRIKNATFRQQIAQISRENSQIKHENIELHEEIKKIDKKHHYVFLKGYYYLKSKWNIQRSKN